MGTGGPASPGYAHAPYFSSQKGAFPANLQEKRSTAQAPSPIQQTALKQGGVSILPRGAVQHRPSVRAQQLPTSHTCCTHQFPARGTSQIFPWFLSHLGFFVPRTSSSLTPGSFHTAPASSVDASAQNEAAPAPSATAGLRQAGKSTFPAMDEATG